jgi:Origin recognition complex subunit 3 insertion domain
MCKLSQQDTVIKMEEDLLDHFNYFLVGLRCLHVMTVDLPQNPLGRQVCYFA